MAVRYVWKSILLYRYQLKRGVRFSAYLGKWIRKYVDIELRISDGVFDKNLKDNNRADFLLKTDIFR